MPKKLRAGDLVEVRSAAEILATLDDNGCLAGLPFMPEMIPYLGGRFRVSKRAHKTCDTVHQTGGRRLYDCVHLEDLRCDGSGHDVCKAACLLFWKTDWLRPAQGDHAQDRGADEERRNSVASLDSLSRTETFVKQSASEEPVYRCQATALYDASEQLDWYDLRQYAEDLTSGNTSLRSMLRIWFFHGLHKLTKLGVGYRVLKHLYDTLQRRVGGYSYPFRSGTVPDGDKTPLRTLNLEPGEQVRVRSQEEILATVNRDNKNRGMRFDPEMVPYCGKVYAVRSRVDRIIHETTGRMIEMQSPSVILDGVVCQSEMSQCRLFCPRAIPSYWREIWLERVDGNETIANAGRSAPDEE